MKECNPASLHDLAPIIEGDQTVGVVCIICGKKTREDMAYGDFVVTDRGLEPNVTMTIFPSTEQGRTPRKDPRF